VKVSTPQSASVSIRDVARRAGVSAATVSRSLRGISNVSPETRDRVLQAANDLAYVRTRAANPARSVGVLARYPAHWFHAHVINAIERVLRNSDRSLVLHNIGEPEGRQYFFQQVAPRRQLDALMVVSSSFNEAEQEALKKLDVPISVVGGYLPELPRVGIDDQTSAAMAVQHLVGLGHREIGLISFEPHSSVGIETTNARRSGFEKTLATAELGQRPEWMVAAASNVTGGIRAAELLLTQPQLPTALFAMSDEMALGVLQTLQRAGIRVPGQMSVIGFDDHEMAPCGDLTTISQPVALQAEMATDILLEELEGLAGATTIRDIDVPTRLVVRGTTGPPPA
jgi:LacI family transcriptional regulator, repressor for deo operon, udp, cdd, tsx, nupC, and nupG